MQNKFGEPAGEALVAFFCTLSRGKIKGWMRCGPRGLPTNGLVLFITTHRVFSQQPTMLWPPWLHPNHRRSICCAQHNRLVLLASSVPLWRRSVRGLCMRVNTRAPSWRSRPPQWPQMHFPADKESAFPKQTAVNLDFTAILPGELGIYSWAQLPCPSQANRCPRAKFLTMKLT